MKKLGIILVFVLLAGAVFLSACNLIKQNEVGVRVNRNVADGVDVEQKQLAGIYWDCNGDGKADAVAGCDNNYGNKDFSDRGCKFVRAECKDA